MNATANSLIRGPVQVCTEPEFSRILLTAVGQKICTIATVSADGLPECAVVGFAIAPEGGLILHTHKYSRKWSNLRANPTVALSISEGIYAPYFQIEGHADLFDSGEKFRYLEDLYIAEHPKAGQLPESFTTGIIYVTPKWGRHFDWPRKTGHCIEWLIGAAAAQSKVKFTIRNAYSDEDTSQWGWKGVQEINELFRFGSDFALVAESEGKSVGAIFVRPISDIGLLVLGPCIDHKEQGGSIGAALIEVASQVVGSHPSLALPLGGWQKDLENCGFYELDATQSAAARRQLDGIALGSDCVLLAKSW